MGSPSQVPGEEVVLDEHVPYSFTQWLGRLSLGRQLPVGVEVEGELRQQSGRGEGERRKMATCNSTAQKGGHPNDI